VDYFDEAIRLDSGYALAYAERSEAWTFIGDLTGQRLLARIVFPLRSKTVSFTRQAMSTPTA